MKVDMKLFLAGRRKLCASGHDLSVPKTKTVDLSASKIYLNEAGNEVHVSGPLVANLHESETLAQKIARFDRLAAMVRQNRAIMQSVLNEDDDYEESDEELLDDSFADDVSSDFDDFGDPIANDNPSPVGATNGDEPAGKPAAPQQAGQASEQVEEPLEDVSE